mmetsp:Transcript_21035/g.74236  ORF Transcript_21035/g.74236 Transcript_21035/m.74236 type:complete len:517 (-) Transcript_21035:131-1681(-)
MGEQVDVVKALCCCLHGSREEVVAVTAVRDACGTAEGAKVVADGYGVSALLAVVARGSERARTIACRTLAQLMLFHKTSTPVVAASDGESAFFDVILGLSHRRVAVSNACGGLALLYKRKASSAAAARATTTLLGAIQAWPTLSGEQGGGTNVCIALRNLIRLRGEYADVVVGAGGIDAILGVVRGCDDHHVRVTACGVLAAMAERGHPGVRGVASDIIEEVLGVVRPKVAVRQKRWALITLVHIVERYTDGAAWLADAGGIDAMIGFLQDDHPVRANGYAHASRALFVMCTRLPACIPAVVAAGGVDVLLRVARDALSQPSPDHDTAVWVCLTLTAAMRADEGVVAAERVLALGGVDVLASALRPQLPDVVRHSACKALRWLLERCPASAAAVDAAGAHRRLLAFAKHSSARRDAQITRALLQSHRAATAAAVAVKRRRSSDGDDAEADDGRAKRTREGDDDDDGGDDATAGGGIEDDDDSGGGAADGSEDDDGGGGAGAGAGAGVPAAAAPPTL